MSLSQFRALPPTDRMLANALTEYEATLCPGCGQPLTESMDPDNEGKYEAPLPSRCHSCTSIAHRMEVYEKAESVDAPRALRFSSRLKAAAGVNPPATA